MSDNHDEAVFLEETVEKNEEETTNEYLEFVGTDPIHGTEFYGANGTHSLTQKHMKEYHDVDLGKKEVVWKRGSNGRFLVPVSDLTPEAVEVLAQDPMFKKVSI